MERKRKLPARAARVEQVSKKRTSTPPEQRTQTPTPSLPPAQPVIEQILPQSIAPGKPLPTVDSPQPENLSANEFQTIPESGVLAESLHRSRQKWLSEGIFEKFWTKPTKRKGAPEAPPNNPPKDSMTKLGPVTITIEPHIFEATMYAVKDTTPKPAPPPPQPMYRPIIQYGPPGGMMPPPPPIPPPVQAKAIPPPQPVLQAVPKSEDVQMGNANLPPQSAHQPSSAAPPPNHSAPNGHPQPPSNSRPQPPTNGHPAPPPSGGRSDPVIQMLAERAATDPDLKALMKTVANGEASPDQLRKFQSHIDELTRIQKLREEQAMQVKQPPPNPPPTSTLPTAPPTTGHIAPLPVPTAPAAPNMPKPTPVKLEPASQPQPQALRSKGPLPSTKPDITNVVFEFHGGNGDRYQFPRHSILEYLPGGQVIASFLIVRKGSSADSPTYDPELDYYQPITIRLYAYQGRQLEALQKVVAPAEDVRRYMDEIMDNATRAEYVLLAMRLPKDKEQTPPVEEEPEKADQVDHQITPWSTTTSTPVPKAVKPAKKLLTEEEQYQAFINTVTPVA